MTAGRLRAGFHDRAMEVRRQLLPFRFGVLAAVAPTMLAWRDQARIAEGLGYSTLYILGEDIADGSRYGHQWAPIGRAASPGQPTALWGSYTGPVHRSRSQPRPTGAS